VEVLRDTEKIAAFLEDKWPESWWREPILLLFGYLDVERPLDLAPVLTRLAGLDEESLPKVAALPLKTQLAAAELCAAAYRECQNQNPDLQERLKARLEPFFRTEVQEKTFFPPVLLASAADALDAFGYVHPNLYRFIPIANRQSPFYIAQFPVTNAQYARFLEAPDFADPDLWRGFPKFDEHGRPMDDDWGDAGLKWLSDPEDWFGNKRDKTKDGIIYPKYWHEPRLGIARPSAPVVGISWYEANAYCRWLTRHWDELEESRANPGLKPGIIRLPTEAEWLAAAGEALTPNPSPGGLIL